MKIVTLLSLLGLVASTASAPTEMPAEEKYNNAITYLLKYKYLTEENKDDSVAFVSALIRLQEHGDIPQTGKLDKETVELMQLSRCGDESNLAEYRVVGSWSKRSLTYRLKDTTNDMTLAQQKEEIRRAFQVWSDVSDLTFTETRGRPDIELRFASGYHGDGDAFDGPGGTLAHAYFPFAGGDCHFDDGENFTFNSSRGINFFQVAAHELGHSLGLDHSNDRGALMAAFYRGYQRNFRLSADDINGIQRIYGQNTKPQPHAPNIPQGPNTIQPRTTRPTWGPRPTRFPSATGVPSGGYDYCQDSGLDAMFTLSNERTYGFKGNFYFRFGDSAIEPSYPRLISNVWPGLPDNVDAAFNVERGPSGREEIWFFKGSRLYYYGTNGRAVRGEREISAAIPGLPNDIDAIFVWSGNSRVYAMKGSNYYKIASTLDKVDPQYPRNINVWTQNSDYAIQQALSSGIDAALQYKNGRTYFFKGQDYYRLTDSELKFDSDYPRTISYWWFGCKN